MLGSQSKALQTRILT